MFDLICNYFISIACMLPFLFILRIYIVLNRIHKRKKIIPRAKSWAAKIMIVLGSGGHTFEMLRLLEHIGPRFKPRIYVIAETDILSEAKITACESEPFLDRHVVEKVPRSREVGQSWITSIFTTVHASIISLVIVFKHKPDAILCNGPGTCVPICLSALLLHILGIKHIIVIYVESICRVKTMSLSGKILYYIADYLLVQWPQLREKYPKAKYIGMLI